MDTNSIHHQRLMVDHRWRYKRVLRSGGTMGRCEHQFPMNTSMEIVGFLVFAYTIWFPISPNRTSLTLMKPNRTRWLHRLPSPTPPIWRNTTESCQIRVDGECYLDVIGKRERMEMELSRCHPHHRHTHTDLEHLQ